MYDHEGQNLGRIVGESSSVGATRNSFSQEADANNRRRRAAKGRAKEEREERAELAPFGEDYGSGGLNRAEIDLFDDDGP